MSIYYAILEQHFEFVHSKHTFSRGFISPKVANQRLEMILGKLDSN